MALELPELQPRVVGHGRNGDLMDALGLAVYATDSEGHITRYNDAAAELWGRRPELNKELWCGSWRILDPATGKVVPHEKCPMAIALKGDRPVRGVEITVERPDGRRSSILPYPTPLHDESGNLIGAVNVLVDITSRKHVEMQLAERTQLTQSITDNMSVGLLMLDHEGRVEFMNPAAEQITGLNFEQLHGQVAHDRIHGRRQDGSPLPSSQCPIVEAAREGRRLTAHEDVFVHPDGSFYEICCNLAPVFREGEQVGSILDLRDVSFEKDGERALRASEERLREAASVKDQFLSLVSHELRTPIATIFGNGLLLQRRQEQLQPEDRRQAIDDIVSESARLQAIIENLLLLTRLEAGRLEAEPLALGPLIEESIAEFKKAAPGREVQFRHSRNVPPALGQQTLLSLVLRNLLSNAQKYSQPDKPIEIRLNRARDGKPQVAVRDHGIGMEDGDIENVFQPFFRSTRARGFAKGLGLGLPVCKRIIDAHGGQLKVNSWPGEGTEFIFTVQAAAEEATPDANSDS